MINWLSGGVVNIARYVTPVLFLIDVLIWFLLVRKTPISAKTVKS